MASDSTKAGLGENTHDFISDTDSDFDFATAQYLCMKSEKNENEGELATNEQRGDIRKGRRPRHGWHGQQWRRHELEAIIRRQHMQRNRELVFSVDAFPGELFFERYKNCRGALTVQMKGRWRKGEKSGSKKKNFV